MLRVSIHFVVLKRRNLTGAPQTTLPQMPYDATMDKLLKRINGPATLTFAAARNFSGANALTAGMSVTQAGGVTGTIAANYSSATTASIVVTVTTVPSSARRKLSSTGLRVG